MRIKSKDKWVDIRYNYGSKKWFFSYLIDGFVFHFLILTIICKYK
jgi:hypothetical protein